jgi:sarcosine oxidase, subunit gamma
MAEASSADTKTARRTPVLTAARLEKDATASVAPLAPIARFALRIRVASATELGHVGPFRFDTPINTCVVENSLVSARLGPDEWLLLDSIDARAHLEEDLNTALFGRFFSLVDIGHRDAGVAVAGDHAREVINAGCPLDLHNEAFPPLSATRTIFGKAEIVLFRPGMEALYRVECSRSFAPYVFALLEEAAQEFRSP